MLINGRKQDTRSYKTNGRGSGILTPGQFLFASAASVSLGTTPTGVPGIPASFVVSGRNLTNDIDIAPSDSVEISLSQHIGYSSRSITLTQSGGAVAETTIWVRTRFDVAALTDIAETVVLSSTGASNRNVSVTGNVTAAEAKIYLRQLSGYWGLSEATTRADSSHYPQNLTPTGTVTNATVNGATGSKTTGSGVGGGSYLGFAEIDATQTIFQDTNLLSFAGWINMAVLPATGACFPFRFSDGGGDDVANAYINQVDNKFTFDMTSGGASIGTVQTAAFTAATDYMVDGYFNGDTGVAGIARNGGAFTNTAAAGATPFAASGSDTVKFLANGDAAAHEQTVMGKWITSPYLFSAANRTWLYNGGTGRTLAEFGA